MAGKERGMRVRPGALGGRPHHVAFILDTELAGPHASSAPFSQRAPPLTHHEGRLAPRSGVRGRAVCGARVLGAGGAHQVQRRLHVRRALLARAVEAHVGDEQQHARERGRDPRHERHGCPLRSGGGGDGKSRREAKDFARFALFPSSQDALCGQRATGTRGRRGSPCWWRGGCPERAAAARVARASVPPPPILAAPFWLCRFDCTRFARANSSLKICESLKLGGWGRARPECAPAASWRRWRRP